MAKALDDKRGHRYKKTHLPDYLHKTYHTDCNLCGAWGERSIVDIDKQYEFEQRREREEFKEEDNPTITVPLKQWREMQSEVAELRANALGAADSKLTHHYKINALDGLLQALIKQIELRLGSVWSSSEEIEAMSERDKAIDTSFRSAVDVISDIMSADGDEAQTFLQSELSEVNKSIDDIYEKLSGAGINKNQK